MIVILKYGFILFAISVTAVRIEIVSLQILDLHADPYTVREVALCSLQCVPEINTYRAGHVFCLSVCPSVHMMHLGKCRKDMDQV